MGLISLIVLVVLSRVGAIQKCCGQMESLDLDYYCIPSGHQWFYMNFSYGIPNCDFKITLADEGSNASCIDNLYEKDSIIAFECEHDPFSFKVPPVNYIRKCCPLTRTYDSIQQSCWGERTVNTEWPQDFLNVLMSGFKGVVDIKVGAPECQTGYALVDYSVPFKQLRREESESIVFKVHGIPETRFNPDEVCLDLTESHDILIVRACLRTEAVCKPRGDKLCVKKCCPDGQSMIGETCVASNRTLLPIRSYNFTKYGPVPQEATIPAFIYRDPCPDDKTLIDPLEEQEINLGLDGRVRTEYGMMEEYCLEYVFTNQYDGNYFYLCLTSIAEEEEGLDLKFVFKACAMIISCIFLFLTLVVYSCVPSLWNLHGKTLMCHVACLLAAYSFLSTVQLLGPYLEDDYICKSLGSMIQFSFLASFAWLNVISFDIWWTFGCRSMRPAMGRKARDKKRFIVYSVYAWTLASLFTIAAIVADDSAVFPINLKPHIGKESCWFSTQSHGLLLFFYGPECLLLGSNVIFFTLTARHYSRVKNELNRVSHHVLVERRFQADKRKLILNLKLFVVMGISWVFEVISSFARTPPEIWYFSDMINALQGLLIFSIFVVKKKVMKAFKRRFKEIVCRVEPKQHRPSTSTLFTVLSADVRMPHPLKKSTSDSRLSVGVPSPKRNHHRCMSSSSTNQLTVNHHLTTTPG